MLTRSLASFLSVSIVFAQIQAFARSSAVLQKAIVVTSPGVSRAEAKAHALKQDKLLLSDYLESARPGPDHDQMLKLKLERAQRAWLSGDVENARSEFRGLTELAMKADWQTPQREVLQAAYLRLAQSSESSTERGGWLESAARLFADLTPNPSLFPPPLLNEFESVRKRLNLTSVEIDLRDVFPDSRYLMIDGRKVEIAVDPRVKLASGLHRLTALSDSNEAVTEFLTAAQLRVLRMTPPSLTDGLCETASLRARTEIPSGMDAEIYSGETCQPKLDLALQGSRFISKPSGEVNFPTSAPTTSPGSKTLLWVGGAALLATVTYFVARSKAEGGPGPQPVHRTGFN